MRQDVEVFVEGEDRVILRCPAISPGLAVFLEGIPHRWLHERGAYSFPVEYADSVRALAWSHFMTDGSATLSTFTLDVSPYAADTSITFAGRLIVERRQPSRRPVLGAGVAIIRGSFGWDEDRPAFTTARLGANNAILQLVLPQSIRDHGIPGLTEVPTIGRREALQAEYGALATRLAWIRNELAA
ncbi:hypothetical protein [Arthrobacter sp. STN4]|uniref:hypothetical protein n=1 Tax=Arthrobacter sp. STN4 TaxID=2923276 RepID=UPI002119E6D1|nr:hypothetical protein [Arthrobacter sp. STN4]MCQ9163001.1 hypothetical protein [Arthrobacter sp. STN4]